MAEAVVPCRLIGVIEAGQRPIKDTRSHKSTRNDRLVAVADKSHRHAGWRSLREVGDGVLSEIERFFVFYNELEGVRFTRGRAPAASSAGRAPTAP